jgi:hypothetical protein
MRIPAKIELLSCVLCILSACGKSSTDAAPAPSTSTTTTTTTAPSTSGSTPTPSSSATPTASSTPTATATGSFSGQYDAKASTVVVPNAKWKGDDDGKTGVGSGTMTLAIAADGSVTGTLEGALGDALLFGHADGATITGTMIPKTPSADSFYGTFVAEKKDGATKGKLMASRSNAGALREADFSLGSK